MNPERILTVTARGSVSHTVCSGDGSRGGGQGGGGGQVCSTSNSPAED